MAQKIFVNLPVKNLEASKGFFEKLGYSFNPQFTDETAAAMVISEDIYVMLLTEEKFKSFTPNKIIADAHKVTETLLALDMESRVAVDDFMDKVLLAGGKQARNPEEYGFMYGRAFEDLDGHIWEIFWMDPNFVQTK